MTVHRELALDYLRRHPDAAAAQLEHWPVEQSAAMLANAPAGIAGLVLRVMLPAYAIRCMRELSPTEVGGMVKELTGPRAALLLRGLDEQQRQAVLDQLPAFDAGAIRLSLNYPESTVGAWTDMHALSLRDDITVADAKRRILKWSGAVSDWIMLIDEHSHLAGWVSLADILRAADDEKIVNLSHDPPEPIRARAALDTVRDHPDWIDHLDRPVINRHAEMIGSLNGKVLRETLDSLRNSPPEAPESIGELGGFQDLFITAIDATWRVWWQLMASDHPATKNGERQ